MNAKRVGSYVVFTLFSAMALLAGIPKLLALEFIVTNMQPLGVSILLIRIAGLIWTLAAIGVWFRQLRSWSALATAPIIFGAIGIHAVTDGLWYGILPISILALLILYIDGFFSRVQA